MLAGLIFGALGATVYVVILFHVGGSGASPDLELRAFDLAGVFPMLYRATFTLFYPQVLLLSSNFIEPFRLY